MDYAFLTLAAVFPMLLVVLGLRPVSDRELTTFSVRYFLLDDLMSPTLSRAIARSRGMRLLGAALGFSLPAVLRALTDGSLNTGPALLWGATGYLGGALLAVLLPIAQPEPVRRAALVPRRAGDYLPRRALAAPAVAVATSVVAALAYTWTPQQHPESSGSRTLWGTVVFTVVAALVTWAGTQLVVRRRQPVPAPDLLAIDDALRAHGLHLVFDTAITLGGLAAALAAVQVGTATSVPGLRWVFICLGLAEGWFATVAWGGRRQRWRVRPKVPR